MQPEKEVKIRANVSAKWHDVFSTLCPPRCLTTQVNCADRPAATVMFSKGEIKPGSKPVTEKKNRCIAYIFACIILQKSSKTTHRSVVSDIK